MFKSGFIPTPEESFTVLTATPGELSGAFDNVWWDRFDGGKGYFVVSYDNTTGDVIATAEATPEPGTLLLIGPAIAFMLWLRCYRKLF
jgi:PEP-CTERM motif